MLQFKQLFYFLFYLFLNGTVCKEKLLGKGIRTNFSPINYICMSDVFSILTYRIMRFEATNHIYIYIYIYIYIL
jgi:hypothetical protein